MTTVWKITILLLLLWSAVSTWHQLDQMERFVAQGPRFTAADGQVLCERVRALEQAAYGYRDTGRTPLACDYMVRK